MLKCYLYRLLDEDRKHDGNDEDPLEEECQIFIKNNQYYDAQEAMMICFESGMIFHLLMVCEYESNLYCSRLLNLETWLTELLALLELKVAHTI